jgi:hypothetical protein
MSRNPHPQSTLSYTRSRETIKPFNTSLSSNSISKYIKYIIHFNLYILFVIYIYSMYNCYELIQIKYYI